MLKTRLMTGALLASAMTFAVPVHAVEYRGNVPIAKKAFAGLQKAYCTKYAPGDKSCEVTAVHVTSNFARIAWAHEGIEGPAIAKWNGKQWQIIYSGGGVMYSQEAIQAGVPRAIAEQLLPMRCPQMGDPLGEFTAWEVLACRNAVYARYGRKFTYKPLQTYFSSQEWYRPSAQYHDGMLTAQEKAYVEWLYAYEKRMGYL